MWSCLTRALLLIALLIPLALSGEEGDIFVSDDELPNSLPMIPGGVLKLPTRQWFRQNGWPPLKAVELGVMKCKQGVLLILAIDSLATQRMLPTYDHFVLAMNQAQEESVHQNADTVRRFAKWYYDNRRPKFMNDEDAKAQKKWKPEELAQGINNQCLIELKFWVDENLEAVEKKPEATRI